MGRFWIAACVIALASLVVGCASGTGEASGSGDAPPPDGAGPHDDRTVYAPPARPPQKQAGFFFPRLDPTSDFPLALGSGRLVVRDRCIRMAPDGRGGLVVWPHGYSLRREGDEILVLNGRGEAVAEVGEEVRMGGGQITQEEAGPTPGAARRAFEEKRGELGVPERCRGPLWVSSEVVRR